MALVVQSFGNETEYRRAVLAVLSYYAQTPARPLTTILFTDSPAFFKPYFEGLPVAYELLTDTRIKMMRGNIDFLHRMKIAIIETAFQKNPGNLLYIDSDTFFLRDPAGMMAELSDTLSCMHVQEYQFSQIKDFPLPAGKPFLDVLNLIKTEKTDIAAATGVTVDESLYSWNAGVMMLHESVSKQLPAVYKITEIIYPKTHNHASEQYAFSIVLQNQRKLTACDHLVYHYWYRIKKRIVDQFLNSRMTGLAAQTLDERLNRVRTWTQQLPPNFETHILTLRDNAVQAFNENKFKEGMKWAVKALVKNPFDLTFVRDCLYHVRRLTFTRRATS